MASIGLGSVEAHKCLSRRWPGLPWLSSSIRLPKPCEESSENNASCDRP